MAKKYRYRKPKLSTSSPSPAIYGMREYIETMNLLSNAMPERMVKGRLYFLMFISERFKKRLEQNAPDIKMGSDEYPYAKDLRIAILKGAEVAEAVAVYVDSQEVPLVDADGGKALYFLAKQGSPEWVQTMMVYGPWPDYMIPIKPAPNEATVITRDARPDELQALEERIMKARKEIEAELKSQGAPEPSFDRSDNASGVVVKEDIGYNILRKEFGLDGEAGVAHWRPAFKGIQQDNLEAMKLYLKYLQTGREGVWGLNESFDEATASDYKKAAKFSAVLAPYVR
jgi:hypothetical protein